MFGFTIYGIGYAVCIYGLAACLITIALRKNTSNVTFGSASLALLVIARLPTILYNRELNADESQVISHAITLLQDPVYWRSVDGTTIGPLNNYLLVLPGLIGLPIDYMTSRLMGLVCLLGSLFYFWKTIQLLYGSHIARLTTLFPLLLLSFTYHSDFLHYSSEQLPLLLLSLTLYFVTRLYFTRGLQLTYAYGIGFFAGMIPFAKLQAVPPALALSLGGLVLCMEAIRWHKQYRPLLALIAGGLSFPGLAFLLITLNNLWGDFMDFYITGNVIYAGGNNILAIPTTFYNLLVLSKDFQVYTIILLTILILTGFFLRDFKPKSPLLLSLTLLYLLTSLYAITKSENTFVHYLHLGIFPFAFAITHFLSSISERFVRYGAFVFLFYFAINDMYNTTKLNEVKSRISARVIHRSKVVEEALRYSPYPTDHMVVWGWQCRYYVEANRPHGTAENHSERSIFDHPLRNTYRTRYMQDMQRTKPVIFIDAVGKNSLWVQDPTTQGYESFPALKEYVHENYTYQGMIEGNKLFIRNDRINNL